MTQNNMYEGLAELGWSSFFANNFQSLELQNCVPARVTGQERNRYKVAYSGGEAFAIISGRAVYRGMPGDTRPAVGDWVAIRGVDPGMDTFIEAILPRKSTLSRQVAGGRDRYQGGITSQQVLAANVDTAFIVSSLDNERNASPRRIERYLALVWSAGADPVIILNKIDICDNIAVHVENVEKIALGVRVVCLSATKKIGLESLKEYLVKGKTAVFLGSSGVGKSSIINAVLGEERLSVGEVRESDFRGRHTTTRRELFIVPGGGMVIDTPGMREIQVWGDGEDVSETFQDIEELAAGCRFRDCTHREEPGCAVNGAIAAGALDAHRLSSYHKLQRETSYLAARQNGRTRLDEKQRWKKISKLQKQYQKKRKDV